MTIINNKEVIAFLKNAWRAGWSIKRTAKTPIFVDSYGCERVYSVTTVRKYFRLFDIEHMSVPKNFGLLSNMG